MNVWNSFPNTSYSSDNTKNTSSAVAFSYCSSSSESNSSASCDGLTDNSSEFFGASASSSSLLFSVSSVSRASTPDEFKPEQQHARGVSNNLFHVQTPLQYNPYQQGFTQFEYAAHTNKTCDFAAREVESGDLSSRK